MGFLDGPGCMSLMMGAGDTGERMFWSGPPQFAQICGACCPFSFSGAEVLEAGHALDIIQDKFVG